MSGFLARIFTGLGRAIASIGYGAAGDVAPMMVAAEFDLDAVRTWTTFNLDAD